MAQGTNIGDMSAGGMLKAKQLGYSDIQIAQRTGATENEVCSVFPVMHCTEGALWMVLFYVFCAFGSATLALLVFEYVFGFLGAVSCCLPLPDSYVK